MKHKIKTYRICRGASRIAKNFVNDFLTVLFNSTFRRNLDRKHIQKQSPSTDR